ncbi:MAG: hypothetical protein WDZ40_02050 [Candidatus Spechtbacterales bacterium]
MITDEYFDIVHSSLEPIKVLLPLGSKLLFETVVDDIVLTENMANETEDSKNIVLNELRIMEKIAESAKGKNSGLYNECFILAELSADNSSLYLLLKRELVLPKPELHDIDAIKRLNAVEQWLMEEDNKGTEEDFFCDYFTEDILPGENKVYLPNRVPERYDSPSPDITFVSIF